MISYTSGDILKADAEALVNTVNCVGVMGRGIALQFKNAFPENFGAYARACQKKEVLPGKMFVYRTGTLTTPYFIINFPTKRHWRGKSRLEDIDSGLQDLVSVIRHYGIRSIAIPPLGSGLGGLDWSVVRSRIEAALAPLADVSIIIYEPNGAPEADKMVHRRDVPAMTPGRAILVSLIARYLRGLLDPFVTLIEVHKLLYFMQVSGEALRLRFKPAAHGPYADNLRHLLHSIEGYMISGYGDGGDSPQKPLELVPGAVDEARNFLEDQAETRQRFDRIADLVAGFESPFGLELLATVHWVCTKGARKEETVPQDMDELVRYIYQWDSCKRQFSPRQIALAHEVLIKKGWLTASLHSGTSPFERCNALSMNTGRPLGGLFCCPAATKTGQRRTPCPLKTSCRPQVFPRKSVRTAAGY